MRRKPSLTAPSVIATEQCVAEHYPATAAEMTTLLGKSRAVVNVALQVLRENRKVRISAWTEMRGRGGDYIPLYSPVTPTARGVKRADVHRPPKRTQAERWERYGETVRARWRAQTAKKRGADMWSQLAC